MAKYLVTGGAGFIGSSLVEKLLVLGHEVRVIDNLSTGRFENLSPYMGDIEFICGDLANYEAARKAAAGVDYILHQAALPSVPLSVKDPVASHHSMVTATVNLLKAAADGGTVKRIVQASTSAVYGDDPILPKREDMAPRPLSPYAAAKLAQEHYGAAFSRIYGLEVLSLRYFNVFGPRQDPDSCYAAVIPRFISRMLGGERPVIYGDGFASRDFVHIDNVVEANLLASTCRWPGDAAAVNIGCGRSYSLNELVQALNRVLHTDLEARYAEERAGDIRHSAADITQAGKVLGYEVKVDFAGGLASLADWYGRYRHD